MRARVIRGSAIGVFGKLAEQGLRLGGNLIVTRLLFPDAFGIMALVNSLVMGLEMLSDLGVRVSVISHPRGDEREFLDTAWTISVLRGAAIALLAALFAWPFALAYDEPALTTLIPVTALSGLLNGLSSTKLAVLNRHLRLGMITTLGLGSQVVALAAMIAFAWLTRSIWALVVGSVVMALTNMLSSHLLIPGPFNRPRWDREAARDILSFGKWIFASTLMMFLAMRLDIFLLGALVPMDQLGVYSIAGVLSSLPTLVGGHIHSSVLLPALAAANRQDRATMEATYHRARGVLVPTGAFVCLSMALTAPAFFHFLYDERYRAAGWIAPLLMIGVWFFYLQEASARAVQAMGEARILVAANAIKLLVLGAGAVAGYQLAELPGFILGSALGSLGGQLTIERHMRKQGIGSSTLDLVYSIGAIGTGALGLIAGRLLGEALGVPPAAATLGVAVVILTPLGLVLARKMLAEMRR